MVEHKHPITPPLELVREWAQINGEKDLERFWMRLATQAARWGADQELEACCEWLEKGPYGFTITASAPHMISDLREARRPKPPSLAEEALEALEQIDGWAVSNMNHLSIHDDLVTGVEAIRTALERLKELEKGNE